MPRYGVFSEALAFPYRQKNNVQTYLYFLSFRSKKLDLFPVNSKFSPIRFLAHRIRDVIVFPPRA